MTGAPAPAPLTRRTPGTGLLRDYRAAPALPRLLVASQFAFNTGFFAVLPHLADHLGSGLGLAGWLVGLVLGLRTFSQQGLFVVGGTLTDRHGPRPVVLTGCALRVAGFCWLGFAGQTWSVIGAVLLIGFAAALFSPAVETEIARQAVRHEADTGVPRTRMLAVFSAGGQAGALLGPALGALLLTAGGEGGFRLACLAGAAIFTLVLVQHHRLMPRGRTGSRAGDGPRPRGGPALLLREPRFLTLAAVYSCYLIGYNQLYLLLPAELSRATGSQAGLGWLFALSSLIVVAGQLPLSRWSTAHLAWPGALRAGMLLIAASFAVPGALVVLGPGSGGPWPAITFVVLLTLGQMLVVPTIRAWLPELVEDRHLGFFTGALASLSGTAVLVGGAPLGAVTERGGVWPWAVPALIALAGTALVPRPGPALTCPGRDRP